MSLEHIDVVIACNRKVREKYLDPDDLKRLEEFANWRWIEFEGGGIQDANTQPEERAKLAGELTETVALILCHGAPRIDTELLACAPKLKLIGELEGDRFASRIDLEAAWERGISTVDTTNGSSYPVAEWALGLLLISMRNAGALFRRIIAGQPTWKEGFKIGKRETDPGYLHGDLYGKRVGLIGCGHIGRRLIKFLRPFEVEIWVHDPYLSSEMADASGFLQTSLDNVLSQCDAIICLAPLTPKTEGMIGRSELNRIPSGSVLINVSRGPIIDSEALIERLKRGDIVAGLDVFDPEPIPPTSEIIQLENVFLSPHIAGVTAASHPRFFKLMVDEVKRYHEGHGNLFELTPRSLANRTGMEV